MRVVIFFQILILFLLNSGDSPQAAVASAHNEKYAFVHSNQLLTPVSFLYNKHTCTLTCDIKFPDQNDFLVTEEVEEDECPNVFAKKFNSSVRNYSIQLYSSLPGVPIHCSKAAQCFYGRVSYKYIQQRVLRV